MNKNVRQPVILTPARHVGTPCKNCGGTIRHNSNKKCVECAKTANQRNKRNRRYSTLRIRRIKDEVIAAYGGKCSCCQERTRIFLTIDHETPCGRVAREPGNILYRRLRREGFPKGYRVLCWNCNVGRHLNGGACPHKGTSK